MLYHLAQYFADLAGPLRLLNSYITLAGLGTALGAVLTWWVMPKLWVYLPIDRGRAYAIDADKSIGKPVSGGVIFIPIFILISLLVVPFYLKFIGLLS